jgi:hypothetical protein
MDKPDREHRRYYWWLLAHDSETNSNTLVFGSDISEADARQHGLEMLGGCDFEIRKLPTRVLAKASSLWKGNRLEKTHSLKEATKRLGHEATLERWKRRQEQRRRLMTQ